MYSSSSLLVVFGALIVTTCSGAPALDDIFSGFVRNVNLNSPNKEGGIVKRRIYEENRDAGLKQISLQSLIGDLEQSLYQSALSVGSVADDKDAEVEEVTPVAKGDHAITKRKSEDETTSASTTEIGHVAEKHHHHHHAAAEPLPEEKKILLQTTQKIPAEHDGAPTHVLIDRISVQPHYGGVPLIPAFQVYHKKVTTATIQEPNSSNQTHISITQTDIKATGSFKEQPESTTVTATANSGSTETVLSSPPLAAAPPTTEHLATTTIASTTTTTTTTTHKSVEEIKEAEEELKEKVAEIEAEPVILSARV